MTDRIINFYGEFYLKPTYRGRDIGCNVLTWVRKEARKMELKVIHLEVGRNSDRARHLYEAAGFKACGDFQLMSMGLIE